MKSFFARRRGLGRFFGFAFFLMLALAPAATVCVHAQQPAPQHHRMSAADNPAATETPSDEEKQENAFLNAPVVHHIAHVLGIQEPTARTIFLVINFAIIFLAIAIPLTRTMPKIFRRRGQTVREGLELARKANEEARQRMNAVEDRLAGLGQEIAAFRAQVEQESLEDEKRVKAFLKEESERIMAQAETEISAAAAHAKRTLRGFAAELAIDQASKQIKLTAETDRALIGEFIGQVKNETAGAAPGGKK